MTSGYMGKYDVLKIVRANVLNGLMAYGLYETKNGVRECTWKCIEANQQSPQNKDKVVTLRLESSNTVCRYGTEYDATGESRTDSWVDEMSWEICVLKKRMTEPVSSDTITGEDVIDMLIGWFNGPGLDYFREFGIAGLYVLKSSVKPYQDDSDVGQYKASFSLKTRVIRSLTVHCGFATPVLERIVSV